MEFVESIRNKKKIELVKVILKKNQKHIEIKEQKTGKYRKFSIYYERCNILSSFFLKRYLYCYKKVEN